jgi:signal transduction histidine kinase
VRAPTLDGMRWRGRLSDVTAAVLTCVVVLAILGSGGFGTPDPGSTPLDGTGLLLATASTLPLAFARAAPVIVYAVSAVASIVLLSLGYPLDAPLGPAYAGYVLVVARGGGPRRGHRIVALVAVVAFVPAIAVTLAVRGVHILSITTELGSWALAFAGVWLAGDRTRLRREQLAVAEERARRSERDAEREHRLAAAEERTRIARELHDAAGHAINVILVQAGAARLLHHRDPARSLRAIATIEEVARDTAAEIDSMVRVLRLEGAPPTPADPAALEDLLEHHRRSGLRLATTIDGVQRALPHGVAWAAYRILQEALTNAARHGGGNADVVVGYGADAIEIAVTNTHRSNGAHAPGRNGGHGILGMRERATLLGGTFDAAAEPGMFRVHAHLPYNAGATT